MPNRRLQLNDAELERSSVVANSTINRERGIAWFNSYAEDLSFDPLKMLRELLFDAVEASWLDLCCGSGRTLIEGAAELWKFREPQRGPARRPQLPPNENHS